MGDKFYSLNQGYTKKFYHFKHWNSGAPNSLKYSKLQIVEEIIISASPFNGKNVSVKMNDVAIDDKAIKIIEKFGKQLQEADYTAIRDITIEKAEEVEALVKNISDNYKH